MKRNPLHGIPPETLVAVVTQASEAVAASITASSCEDTRKLLKELEKTGKKKKEDSSFEARLFASLQTQPELKKLVASRVGTALAIKMMDCNMISPDSLAPLFDKEPLDILSKF
ncbi:MAG: hypothetical protein HC792_05065 [Acaryochloridaceae cyanobacterium CSU_5_19]|nr:hypothetical protein [Acaryochloridaceae cyanobacterium CSU_5_19]